MKSIILILAVITASLSWAENTIQYDYANSGDGIYTQVVESIQNKSRCEKITEYFNERHSYCQEALVKFRSYNGNKRFTNVAIKLAQRASWKLNIATTMIMEEGCDQPSTEKLQAAVNCMEQVDIALAFQVANKTRGEHEDSKTEDIKLTSFLDLESSKTRKAKVRRLVELEIKGVNKSAQKQLEKDLMIR